MKKNNSYLLDLIKSQKDNFSLDQSFYTNKSIFEMDLKTFFLISGFLLDTYRESKIKEITFCFQLVKNQL